MNNAAICVVSYKRPKNKTCDMLMQTSLNWIVFVYELEPNLREYIDNYGMHVHIIPKEKIQQANLPKKRQYVLDYCYENYFSYCIMLDDDIEEITHNDNAISIEEMCSLLYKRMEKNTKYVAISAAYNKSDNDITLEKYKNICNNTIFDLILFHSSKVKYNPESKCEDMELTINLFINGYVSARYNTLIVHNTLQGGTTNDGLSYRFEKNNRFIIEGEYMSTTFPEFKEIFEYDETHFKMNTEKLLKKLKVLNKTVYK